jgi:transcriptional regulator with XRE-family HTH domain
MTPPSTLVRQARINAGLTQAALAARLGATQAAVARLERPGANPTVDTLDRVMKATGHRLELSARPTKAEVDEAQIIERLKLTPAERLRAFEQSYARTRELVNKAQLQR